MNDDSDEIQHVLWALSIIVKLSSSLFCFTSRMFHTAVMNLELRATATLPSYSRTNAYQNSVIKTLKEFWIFAFRSFDSATSHSDTGRSSNINNRTVSRNSLTHSSIFGCPPSLHPREVSSSVEQSSQNLLILSSQNHLHLWLKSTFRSSQIT